MFGTPKKPLAPLASLKTPTKIINSKGTFEAKKKRTYRFSGVQKVLDQPGDHPKNRRLPKPRQIVRPRRWLKNMRSRQM